MLPKVNYGLWPPLENFSRSLLESIVQCINALAKMHLNLGILNLGKLNPGKNELNPGKKCIGTKTISNQTSIKLMFRTSTTLGVVCTNLD